MMATIVDSVVIDLRRGLSALEAERDQAIEKIRASYQERIDSLAHAIAMYAGDGNVPARFQSSLTEQFGAVGEDRLQAVREYMRTREFARQADIASALGMNSGSVSVALRHLRAGGEVRPGRKEYGSRVWEIVNDRVEPDS